MKLYNTILKKPWPYIVGGSILALLNVLALFFTGETLRVTSGFLYIGVGLLEKLGVNPSNWYYFNHVSRGLSYPNESYFFNYIVIIDVAIVLGALITTLWANEFKIRKIKNLKQVIFGLIGGIIMGYGSRLSFGCNVGAYFSAIPSMSLHGWIFAIFMFIGSFIGSKILIRYLM